MAAAEIDITPAVGLHMGGDMCRHRPVENVRDPLYARALVVEEGESRVCLVTLDLCTAGNDAADRFRQAIGERFHFARGEIMLHVLQNHSGPSLGGHLLFSDDSPQATPGRIVAASGELLAELYAAD